MPVGGEAAVRTTGTPPTICRLGTACLAAAALLGAGGCANFWDEVTSRDFKFKNLFEKKDPIVVLRTSADGDQRAKAIVMLSEPKQHGGSDQDQQMVME